MHNGITKLCQIIKYLQQYFSDAPRSDSSRSHIELEEGVINVVLECPVCGYPSPETLGWLYEGGSLPQGVIQGENNSLLVHKLSQSHQGKYTCTATNTVAGRKKTHTAELHLDVKRMYYYVFFYLEYYCILYFTGQKDKF